MRRPICCIALCSIFACGGAERDDVTPADDTGVVADTSLAPAESGEKADSARAQIVDAAGRGLGAVILSEEAGGVKLTGALIGLPPGEHGFHIHQTGRCEPPAFESAGPHLAPTGNPHGFDAEGGPHAGDLRNLVAGPDSIATVEATNMLVSIRDGATPLLDDDGSALVVHAAPDDYVTQPAGDSGDRIACGVIGE
jgi:Cu-Zn family superoxide dismutase